MMLLRVCWSSFLFLSSKNYPSFDLSIWMFRYPKKTSTAVVVVVIGLSSSSESSRFLRCWFCIISSLFCPCILSPTKNRKKSSKLSQQKKQKRQKWIPSKFRQNSTSLPLRFWSVDAGPERQWTSSGSGSGSGRGTELGCLVKISKKVKARTFRPRSFLLVLLQK